MSQENRTNRRTYIKYTGAAAIATLAGCSGGGNGDTGEAEPNHEVPHPDDGTVPDVEATAVAFEGEERDPDLVQQKDADAVNYQHTPESDQYCGNCEEYVPDEDGDGYGACLKVAGKIHPCDWCALYVGPYEGDDVASCSM
ncbi:hypothetical protein [Halodesulfurarchaeum sp.]|uniref:hypothetical protein n=1 Tax=Halodesulfurarchaeum sp. TaxID=1980530 RepID=UPI002FC3BEBF